MGTNFYVAFNVCPTCGRGESYHLGKRSAGWVFTFQGYNELVVGDKMYQLRSAKEWRNFILETKAIVEDEYGAEHDPNTFFEEVKAARDNKTLHTPLKYYGSDVTGDYRAWKVITQNSYFEDPEGYAFCMVDFS